MGVILHIHRHYCDPFSFILEISTRCPCECDAPKYDGSQDRDSLQPGLWCRLGLGAGKATSDRRAPCVYKAGLVTAFALSAIHVLILLNCVSGGVDNFPVVSLSGEG